MFYQIYPRSFMDGNGDGIGDLAGIIEKLDYLNDGTPRSLGIDAIWFSPFFTSPDRDFGYDVADYCAIDPRYGTIADFNRLVQEAHRRGIRILLDLVVNHTSSEHPWFKESRASRESAKRDWYIWRDGRGPGNKPPNNWRNNFFGPAWTWDELTGQYYLHSFLKEQPDLNWQNPAVQEAVFDAVRFWLERGADGFRLDVAHAYCKDEQFRDNPPFYRRRRPADSQPARDRSLLINLFHIFGLPELQLKKYNEHHPATHRVLKEFRQVLDSYPEKTSVGEIFSEDPHVQAAYYGSGNDELHLNFHFDLMHCRWNAGAFRRCVERWERLLPAAAWPAYTFNNHDNMRSISRYGQGGQGDQQARLLALLLLTLRGAPFIYYGEEIGMKDPLLPKRLLQDPVGLKWYPLHRGRDGARTPMQWSGGAAAGFSRGEPWLPVGPEVETRNVAAQAKDPASLLSFYRRLIRLRKEMPSLRLGGYRTLAQGAPDDCYCYLRELDGRKAAVALNFSRKPQVVDLSSEGNSWRLILSTDPRRNPETGISSLTLKPNEGCLLLLEVGD
ncbi:MAG: alpha-glucosidase [Bacillota bacterium]